MSMLEGSTPGRSTWITMSVPCLRVLICGSHTSSVPGITAHTPHHQLTSALVYTRNDGIVT